MRVRHVLHQHKHFIKYSDQYYCTVSDYGQGDLIAIIFLDEGVISKTLRTSTSSGAGRNGSLEESRRTF